MIVRLTCSVRLGRTESCWCCYLQLVGQKPPSGVDLNMERKAGTVFKLLRNLVAVLGKPHSMDRGFRDEIWHHAFAALRLHRRRTTLET